MVLSGCIFSFIINKYENLLFGLKIKFKIRVPCHWARQCPLMAPSLNLTGEEEVKAIFIPVNSAEVSQRLVHAVATNAFLGSFIMYL